MYCLPFAVSISMDPQTQRFEAGHFSALAYELGGDWMQWLLFTGSFACFVGLYDLISPLLDCLGVCCLRLCQRIPSHGGSKIVRLASIKSAKPRLPCSPQLRRRGDAWRANDDVFLRIDPRGQANLGRVRCFRYQCSRPPADARSESVSRHSQMGRLAQDPSA